MESTNNVLKGYAAVNLLNDGNTAYNDGTVFEVKNLV